VESRPRGKVEAKGYVETALALKDADTYCRSRLFDAQEKTVARLSSSARRSQPNRCTNRTRARLDGIRFVTAIALV
jgi:hypothetical protein